MESLTVSKEIAKYFEILKNLDGKAKKSLINELRKSIDFKSKNEPDIKSLFSVWEDIRNSNEIKT